AVEVQIETGGEPVRARGRTGAGGLFRTVLPFPAEGAPDAPAGIVVFSDRRGGTRRESLPLRAVAEGAGFRVALSSGEPGTVRVKVMRDDGTPEVRWVMLRFEAAGGAEVMRWTALGSEGTGEFQVPPGRYDSVGLAVGQPFGDARRAASAGGLDVAPGSTTDLSFTVPRGADLELRLPGAQDRAQVELRCGEETFHSSIWGRMRVTDLPPGTLTVVVTRNGKSPVERTVTLVRGAMTTVEFP
ncbi:MAG: hypothetical protein MUE73_11790, partial [Planctomycetes bacterium]|nr:hypothetical protein [Planctomycetota bacterium]